MRIERRAPEPTACKAKRYYEKHRAPARAPRAGVLRGQRPRRPKSNYIHVVIFMYRKSRFRIYIGQILMRQDRGGRGRHEPPQNDGTRRAFGCLQMVANIGLLHQWETPFASSRKTTRQPTKKGARRAIPLSRPKGERL